MAWSRSNALLATALLFAAISLCYCGVVTKGGPVNSTSLLGNGTSDKKAGICTLEVQTVDLLSEDDKQGVIPKGNGSRPNLSKIEVCCIGWRRKAHSAYRCEPVCDNDCVNGNCTAPNVCICLAGYIHDLARNCVPTCGARSHACLNGVCTTSGVCSCNAGYHLDAQGLMCVPTCTGGCGHGNCTAPETCACDKGFVLNKDTQKCEYHCEGGCGTGVCIGPNQCSCKPGFVKRGNTCEPECPGGCRNGVCIGPNKCGCKEGWNLDAKTGMECVPHCEDTCLNAVCSAPNTCTCKQGYIKDLRSSPGGNRCVAHCPSGCANGSCSAPNFCICNPGFVKEVKGSNKCVKRERRSIRYDLIPKQL